MTNHEDTTLIKDTLLELKYVLGENNAVLRDSKKVSEDLGKIVHRANNLKQAEINSAQDKKLCYKVFDRVADLVENRPVILYLIILGILARIGIDIASVVKAAFYATFGK